MSPNPKLDVMLDVATSYTNVLHAQRHVEVTEQAVTSLASHTREAKNRIDQGVGIRNDLLASQVALSNAQQQNLQADATLDIARAAYNRALQRPIDTDVTIEDLREPLRSYDVEQLTQQALARRPEIAELNAHVRAMRSQAGVVRGSYKPQIAVEGGFQFIENRFLDNEAFNRVALMCEWNVFDMGRKRHSAAKLDQSAEAVLRQRNDVESKIALQVRGAWRRLETARERVRVSRATIESAEENLRVARNRYSQGVGTNTVVLDAETLRTQAYSNYYSSVYSAVRALMQLGRAVGDFAISVPSNFSDELPAPLPEQP
jgi:outer membrane protein